MKGENKDSRYQDEEQHNVQEDFIMELDSLYNNAANDDLEKRNLEKILCVTPKMEQSVTINTDAKNNNTSFNNKSAIEIGNVYTETQNESKQNTCGDISVDLKQERVSKNETEKELSKNRNEKLEDTTQRRSKEKYRISKDSHENSTDEQEIYETIQRRMSSNEQNPLDNDKFVNVAKFIKPINFPELEINDFAYRFSGAAFSSFRERPLKYGLRRWSVGEWRREMPKPEAELSRSQYSLVSCTDLTAGAIQLWMGLPEEVKYDPALAPFRQFYEKEYGKLDNKKSTTPLKQRLPSVNSAPHLNNNHHLVNDEPSSPEKPQKLDRLLEDNETKVSKKTLVQNAQHYVKMSILLACWVFFTAVFLMYNEKEQVTRNSSVAPFEVKSYTITQSHFEFSILLGLSGPFLSETGELKMNSTEVAAAKKMEVWLERIQEGDVVQMSDTWRLVLLDEADLDFSEGELRSTTLKLEPRAGSGDNISSTIALRIRTTANTTTPFSMSYTANPLDMHTGVIYASVLLFGLYVLIIFEIINRTMAAVLISTLSLAALAMVGERPTLPEIISWLDVETLLLLFSMMLLVAIMAETGMFDFLAVFTFEVTKGKLWPLISVLCTITAVLSTFLDNVTTVLLMTPVTIRLCEVMDLDPIPVLMSMVLFSNIGGTATPVGDPPNVIIASNKAVVQAGVNFTNFTLHMTIGILLVCVQTCIQLRFIYRDTNKLRLNEPRDIKDLRHQISIWRRAAESLPHMSRDEHVVRERLERKVKKLTAQLDTLVKQSNKRACPKDTFKSTLAEMKEKYKIRDKMLLVKSTVAIGFVVMVFFLHSIPELNRVSLGWTALLGAILLLTLADREDLEPILHRVEWSTLLFFAALFVLMEALSKLGLIEFIGGITQDLILSVDEKARLAVAILLMLWVSGVTSAFVDNIPLTTMMVRVVTSLGSNPTLGLPMTPLIWALSFGACLGGNGTLIGASANVVCAGVAEHHGYKFTFMQFFKIGFPIMIGHLIVASGYLLICHCLFTWH